MSKFRRIIVYGAGGVAKELLILLLSEGIGTPSVAITNKTKEPQKILGIDVEEIDVFKDYKEDSIVIVASMEPSASEMAEHARNIGFANVETIDHFLDKFYSELWERQVVSNRILITYQDGYGGNEKYIANEILRRELEIELIWALKDRPFGKFVSDRIHTVQYGTKKYYEYLATSRIWIDNEHKSYLSRKRSGQYYIQTWHGAGPIKKIEHDAEDALPASYLALCDYDVSQTDLMVSPAGFNSNQYRRAFRYKGEILESGYPRNDILFHAESVQGKVRAFYDIPEGNGIVLFAPTYREEELEGVEQLDIVGIKQTLAKRFGKDFTFMIRFHPFDKRDRKIYGESIDWLNATDYDDIQELLIESDVLITDYSSVMWDFSLQIKPVFLFHPDEDFYKRERGNYLPFSEMPYIVAKSNEELKTKIGSYKREEYQDKLRIFLEKYQNFSDGFSSKRVVDKIESIL